MAVTLSCLFCSWSSSFSADDGADRVLADDAGDSGDGEEGADTDRSADDGDDVGDGLGVVGADECAGDGAGGAFDSAALAAVSAAGGSAVVDAAVVFGAAVVPVPADDDVFSACGGDGDVRMIDAGVGGAGAGAGVRAGGDLPLLFSPPLLSSESPPLLLIPHPSIPSRLSPIHLLASSVV
jgi:hypothetical protein